MLQSISNMPAYINTIKTQGFKDPSPIEEDPEASRLIFSNKESLSDSEVYNPFKIAAYDIKTEHVLSISEELERLPVTLPSIYRSYKHISLPEALVYCYILDHPQHRLSEVILKPNAIQIKQGFVLDMFFKLQDNHVIHHLELRYKIKKLHVDIREDGHDIGHVRYILRGKKCEEIMGTFRGKPLMLDPVWKSHRKGEIREEHFSYDTKKTTLIYQGNIKHSGNHTFHTNQRLSMNQQVKKDKSHCWVTKSVTCNTTHCDATILFHKKILIPIAAKFTMDSEIPSRDDTSSVLF